MLIRSARSSNIKERHDASTALFDPHGEMVMQAEHIPVHLGSMPAAVAAILGEDHSEPGRSWILNDPFAGGTHLPDITVITPVLMDGALLGFAAARAHHADVGGRIPGSMPADSHTLEEEGIVIGPTRLDEATLGAILAGMRQPRERLADLRAQLAANRTGAERLRELAGRPSACGGAARGIPRAVLDYAERRTRACLERDARRHASRPRTCLEAMEGDLTLRLQARRSRASGWCSTSPAAHPSTRATSTARWPSRARRATSPLRVLTDPDIPPSRRRLPADRAASFPRGCLLNRRARARPSRPATSRPPRGSPTSCWAPSAGRSARGR